MIPAFLLAYLLGSIPFGLLLTKAAGLGDVRAIGSGNIGATNVLRTGNKKLAALTLLLDGAKGIAAVYLGERLGAMDGYAILTSLLCAVIVALGHMFPVWLKFKGGKGVATTIGALIALAPWLGFSVIALWIAIFAATRISSLSALIGIGASPLIALLFGERWLIIATVPLAVLVAWRHKENIKRLINGTEHRFSAK